MDLTLAAGETTLNIRVAVILETTNGFLLEKNIQGWYFFPGGRIKAGENSLQAAKREILEETGREIHNFTFVSTLENFFTASASDIKTGNVHEICFVYRARTIGEVDPKFGLQEFTKEKIQDLEIRPDIMKQMVLSSTENPIGHHII